MSTVARITNDKKLELYDEVMEYPTELEGGRNLFRQSNYSNHIHGDGRIYNITTSNVVKVEPNTTYTISYTVTESNRFGIYQGDLPNGDITKPFSNVSTVLRYIDTAEGSKINRTFTTGSVGEFIFVYLSFGNSSAKEPYLKLEKDNIATDWTPAPEDLEHDFPPEITSFKPGISSGGILLTPEVMEYPSDFEGGRNLVISNEYVRFGYREAIEIDGYSLTMKEALGNSPVFYVIHHKDKGSTYTLSFKSDTEDVSQTRVYGYGVYPTGIVNDRLTLISGVSSGYTFTPDDNVEYIAVGLYSHTDINSNDLPYTFYDWKLEKGNVATDWTPAPEDLGMDYPDDIKHFSTGFRSNGKVLVSGLEEGVVLDG